MKNEPFLASRDHNEKEVLAAVIGTPVAVARLRFESRNENRLK